MSDKWIWRDGEFGLKTFTNLTRKEKEEHLKFLLQLDKDKLSTNDQYILRIYGPENYIEEKTKKFISMDI